MTQTHYFWYDNTGRIRGAAPGHWTTDWDGDDPTSPDCAEGTHARSVRDFMLGPDSAGDIVGGIEYTCPCDPLDDTCVHVNNALRDYYVSGGTLTLRPTLTILVDDVSHPPRDATPIQKSPGSSITLRLQATVPDDTQITLSRQGAVISPDDPVLTFTSGETNTINLTAPGQGQIGAVFGEGLLIQPVVVRLLGWT